MDILLLLICIPCIVLHCIGIYLIILTLKRDTEKVQQLYILYLSLSEVGVVTVRLTDILVRMTLTLTNPSNLQLLNKISSHLENINFTLFSFMYYSAMLFITIDRLVACCWERQSSLLLCT